MVVKAAAFAAGFVRLASNGTVALGQAGQVVSVTANLATCAAVQLGRLGFLPLFYPAQQESLATSLVKPWAASFSPSTVVR